MSLLNPERAGLRPGAVHQKLHQVGIEPHCFAFIVLNFLCYSYVKWYQFSIYVQFSSVQFSRSVMSDSLWPHGLQDIRLPCPSPTSELAQIHFHQADDAIQPCHPVIPFSSCLQSFPVSGSFPMSQFFASGGQSIAIYVGDMQFPLKIELSLKREAISRKICGKE